MKLTHALPALALVGLGSCSGDNAAAGASLQGRVVVDGSSTVSPISEAVAEEFAKVAPRVRVGVAISGTGGGFSKFTAGETDINDASRPIKKSEADAAAAKKIEFVELPIAFDGIAIVVNKANDWVDELSVEQLAKIWQQGSTVKTWRDVEASWPDKPIKLFGPGSASGTFDSFTESINGKVGNSRNDFTASEIDDNLVQGVAGEPTALGYFGFAFYEHNHDKLKLLRVKGPKGAILPSRATIEDGTYAPLSRPLFIYVRRDALDRPEVTAFTEFYLENAAKLAAQVGYVALPAEAQRLTMERFKARKPGTMYAGDTHKPLLDMLRAH